MNSVRVLILHSFVSILEIAIFFILHDYFPRVTRVFAAIFRLLDYSAIRNVVVIVVGLAAPMWTLPRVLWCYTRTIPVLSWEHYVHPHPVNRERNASQVVILLCLRRGKTWNDSGAWNPGETKSDGNRRSNREDCRREVLYVPRILLFAEWYSRLTLRCPSIRPSFYDHRRFLARQNFT